MQQNAPIYKVTTEGDCEGRSIRTLGYCTGDIRDIEAYFKNEKAYSLSIEPITVKHIDKQVAANKAQLIERKRQIEKELENIKRLIG